MWARKRLDIGWSDLAFGLWNCWVPHDLSTLQRRVEAAWSKQENTLACLSVRSGFDLLLDDVGRCHREHGKTCCSG